MTLMALLTLLGLTLVLVTSQGRLSALAASRKGLQSEHDDQELASVLTQVAAGSTDSNSSFGAHGLLEDIYGLPQFFGQIAPAAAGPTVLPIGETAGGATFLAGGNNGTLLQLTIIKGNANAVGAAGLGAQTAMQYVLPQNSGAFCGQVITMLTGPAAGQSARVVGYYFNPALANSTPQVATMQVSSFGGVVPQPGDQFMINGRPFSGTGFGLNLSLFQGGAPWTLPNFNLTAVPPQNGNIPLLTATETLASVNPQVASALPMPYAYLPNHAQIPLSAFLPTGTGTYWDPAGPGGANEPYDAPDFQNLMLAMHYWSPFLLPGNTQVGVVTPIPSLHRPELVGWYYNQAIINANPAISMANPVMRRKVILRPEPTDHTFVDANGNGVWDAREPFHDVNGDGVYSGDVYADGTPAFLDLNGDGAWTPGETDYTGNTFNPVTGCWYIAQNGAWALDKPTGAIVGLDVDNDMDGIPDSIWVDAGLPVHTEADGTFTKNLAAVLCIDLDGKVNLNAHGTLAQLDQARYLGYPLSTTTLSGPLAGGGGSASLYSDALFQRNVPVGQGYGPADVNPLHVFVRSHTPTAVTPHYTYSNGTTSGVAPYRALNYYKTFLQGFDYQAFLASYNGYAGSGLTPPVLQVDGRFGESARLTASGYLGFSFPGVFPPGSYNPVSPPLTYTQQLLNGPRPGWSQWFDPYTTSLLVGAGYAADWVNDPVALARFSDIRPGLLQPPLASATPFFFDFLVDTLPLTPPLPVGPATHVPTAHGTPSDLHSRGLLAADLTGRPYYGGTAYVPWQTLPSVWYATMTDYAAGQYVSAFPFLGNEVVLNEAVDTQYEMDLTQNARQGGQNSGNSVSNVPDFTTLDAKLTPSELEGILRANEQSASGAASSANLLKRLNDLETAANYLTSGSSTSVYSLLANKNTASSTPPTTISPRDDIRLAVTSESWDLPMPNLALTPRQIQDVVLYIDYYVSAGLPVANTLINGTLSLNNISLVDLARVRIFADNYDPTTLIVNPNFPLLSSTLFAPDTALFGNLKNIQPSGGAFPFNPTATPPLAPVWPLLAPETVLGMRFDVNRLLGNGQDDNGNGVVDEPGEVLWQDGSGRGEYLVYPFSQINKTVAGPAGQINTNVTQQNNMLGILDLNNDGFYPIGLSGTTSIDPLVSAQTGNPVHLPADTTNADLRARQLLAKQLYCLMMLLLDDRPYSPAAPQETRAQIFNSSGPLAAQYILGSVPYLGATATNLSGLPDYNALASLPREQSAYVIAQWAINVVDFRDRDSIMTPFEFDIYPFRADPYVVPTGNLAMAWVVTAELNLTWNVDDIIDPWMGAPLAYSHQDDSQAYRGLVWGCERPELLLTETVAFHDRGTADTAGAQPINDPVNFPDNPTRTPPGDTLTTAPAEATQPRDLDFDQVRRPRGSMIVELFNPTSYWDAPQFDMQTSGGVTPQPRNAPDMNGNQGYGVNLAQVATGQPAAGGPASSPVWRIVIAYSPWQANESMCYNTAPTGITTPIGGGGRAASPQGLGNVLDPRAPVLPPGAIHRAVYFAPFMPAFVTGGGAAFTSISVVADTLLNNSFFADPDIFIPLPGTSPETLMLPPGQYALVGPANQNPTSGGAYVVYAGNYSPVTGYPFKLQLGNPTAPRTLATLYGATGMPQGPYAAPGSIKPVIGVPIQTNWFLNAGGNAAYVPHNSTGAGAGATVASTLRMSVSEPEHGYPVWPGASLQDDVAYYTVPGTPSAGIIGGFPQHPFDSSQGNPASPTGNGMPPQFTSYLLFGDLPNPYVAPPAGGGATQSTTLGYTVLYLQRLANPLQAWDQKLNPYITVDSMPVDLTAYTGEPSAGGAAPPEIVNYPLAAAAAGTYLGSGGPNNVAAAASWTASTATATSFDTRRRGYSATGATLIGATGSQSPTPNVWTPLPVPTSVPATNLFAGTGFGNNSSGTYLSPMTISAIGGTVGSTLGYVNWEYSATAASGYTTSAVYTSGSAPVGASGMPAAVYNGDPQSPFPWLAWNNRPYVSQYELMLVPASSPSSQAQDFGMLGWAGGATPASLNEFQPYAAGMTPVATMLPAAQFMQLLNFFNNEQTLTATDTTNLLPNLHRIFEFLQVPSRYTGTQDMLNPSQFAGDNAALIANTNAPGAMTAASHLFHTPFNWLPRYREPGKINLNTIFDPVVFQSLMDDYPGTLYANTATDLNPITGFADATLWPRGLWASLTRSRQGFYEDPRRPYMWGALPQPGPYTVNSVELPISNPSAPPNPVTQFAYNTGMSMPGLNADVPTYFANPFRPDGSAAFVPPADLPSPVLVTYPWLNQQKLMHQWTYPSPTPLVPGTAWNNGVNATLLRTTESSVLASETMTATEAIAPPGQQSSFPMIVTNPTTPAAAALPPSPAPLAMLDGTAFDTTNLGVTYKTATTSYRNAGQDAAFQYQMFTRLGNTTTNRSNVYAIWITLGKFQVQQVGVSASNPDGYKLVAPVMDATGNQVKTRGFYIFDRSIPMGFQRGQDVNTERGLLVERVLE